MCIRDSVIPPLQFRRPPFPPFQVPECGCGQAELRGGFLPVSYTHLRGFRDCPVKVISGDEIGQADTRDKVEIVLAYIIDVAARGCLLYTSSVTFPTHLERFQSTIYLQAS